MRGIPPVVDRVDFLTEKNWLCWDVGPALFSKVTLFSLPEVFYGPQICQKCIVPPPNLHPSRHFRCLNSHAFAAQLLCPLPPNVKSWLCPCMVVVVIMLDLTPGGCRWNYSYLASHINSMLISKAVNLSRPKIEKKITKFVVQMIAYYKSIIFRF